MANSTATESPYNAAYITVETIIAGLAVLGNALVIGAVKRNRGLRNVTFCCLGSLALADMAVGLVVIPLSIAVDSALQTNFYACLFMCCNLIIFTNASILSLLAIAVDRYLRIKMPTRLAVFDEAED
ncbi:adenosine receptor A3-like isoform X2 [Lissotriton helveticus]